MKTDETRKVTVCAACGCASCWQGAFYCEEYKTAGTRQVSLGALREAKLESPHYWTEGKP